MGIETFGRLSKTTDPVPIPVGTGLPVIGHVTRMSGIDLPEG